MGGVAIDKETKTHIYIDESAENFALHHDMVEVLCYDNNKPELNGKITKITQHNTTHLIGRIIKYK